MITLPSPAIKLYVGGHASRVQGEVQDLTGPRCFSAAHRPQVCRMDVNEIDGLLDSGAFTDVLSRSRLTPELALSRQLRWEEQASEKWGGRWRASAIVGYDRLIDEKNDGAGRRKERWTVTEADAAVAETIEAARYLAARRRDLYPRELVLPCQGVSASQYEDCVRAVLKVATPDDWIGLGGWCILGRHTRYLSSFYAMLARCMPLITAAGVTRVHIFGVLYEPALGALLWWTDECGLRASTDSSAPILNCTRKNQRKAGVRVACGRWRCNVRHWQERLANLRSSKYYRDPRLGQLKLWEGE